MQKCVFVDKKMNILIHLLNYEVQYTYMSYNN